MPGAKPSSLNHFTHCLPTKVVTGKALIPYNLCCMGHPRWTIGASGQQMSLITLRPSVPVKNLGQSSHLTCGRAKRKGNCSPREAGRPPQQLNLFVWVHSMEARGSTSPPQLFACSALPPCCGICCPRNLGTMPQTQHLQKLAGQDGEFGAGPAVMNPTFASPHHCQPPAGCRS